MMMARKSPSGGSRRCEIATGDVLALLGVEHEVVRPPDEVAVLVLGLEVELDLGVEGECVAVAVSRVIRW